MQDSSTTSKPIFTSPRDQKRTFHFSIKKLIESGIRDKIWYKHKLTNKQVYSLIQSTECIYLNIKDCLGGGLDALGMENVVGIFGGLGIALILTLIIFVSEFVW